MSHYTPNARRKPASTEEDKGYVGPHYILERWKAGESESLACAIRDYIYCGIKSRQRNGLEYFESTISIAEKFGCDHRMVLMAVRRSTVIVRLGSRCDRQRSWAMKPQSLGDRAVKNAERTAKARAAKIECKSKPVKDVPETASIECTGRAHEGGKGSARVVTSKCTSRALFSPNESSEQVTPQENIDNTYKTTIPPAAVIIDLNNELHQDSMRGDSPTGASLVETASPAGHPRVNPADPQRSPDAKPVIAVVPAGSADAVSELVAMARRACPLPDGDAKPADSVVADSLRTFGLDLTYARLLPVHGNKAARALVDAAVDSIVASVDKDGLSRSVGESYQASMTYSRLPRLSSRDPRDPTATWLGAILGKLDKYEARQRYRKAIDYDQNVKDVLWACRVLAGTAVLRQEEKS